jgi:hypothetical protein
MAGEPALLSQSTSTAFSAPPHLRVKPSSLPLSWKSETSLTNTFRPTLHVQPIANLPLTDCRPSPKVLLQTP